MQATVYKLILRPKTDCLFLKRPLQSIHYTGIKIRILVLLVRGFFIAYPEASI